MLGTIFVSVYVLLAVAAIISLILYGYHPSKSLGWALVIVALPYVGVLFYLMFGVNRRKLKFFNLKETKKRQHYNQPSHSSATRGQLLESLPQKQKRLVSLLSNSSGILPEPQNEVTFLFDGQSTFNAIFAELEKATEYIHIQYYIIEEGALLDRFFSIISRKIEEGVEVRITYDAVGSYSWSRKSIKRFKDIDVKVYPLMPFRLGSLLFTINYRNHRKIIIIDGQVGFTGGINISDKYVKPTSRLGIWDDMHLCIKGPAVQSLHDVFKKDYYFASNTDELTAEKYVPEIPAQGNTIVQLVASGPDADHASIMQQYLMLISSAEKYVYIANPYFIPSSAILEALKMIAMSGVVVKILVPMKNDSKLAKNSMYSYFESLLRSGVEIYRHPKKFLHSKAIVIDDELLSVGSGNFDYRSFEQNFEVNTMIYDAELAQKIREDIEQDISESILLDLETFQQRPLHDKLLEGVARLFSPLL